MVKFKNMQTFNHFKHYKKRDKEIKFKNNYIKKKK